MAVLPTVGVVVFIGSIGPYFSLGDVQIQALGELILSRIAAIAAEGYHIFRLVGNDIDYTADGIRTIKEEAAPFSTSMRLTRVMSIWLRSMLPVMSPVTLRPFTNISTCLLESPFIIR